MTSPGTIEIIDETPGVVELVIDRPPLNVLDSGLQRALADQLARLADRDDLSALLIRGRGTRAFSVGADIKEMATQDDPDPWSGEELNDHWSTLLTGFPCLTVCCIDGMCLGGGLEVALCADVRIATSQAQFGFPEVHLGLIPGMGGTVRLAELVGPSWARRLILTGEMVDAERALGIGLVQELATDPRQAGLALASVARSAGPLAQRAAKSLLTASSDVAALWAEREAWYRLAHTADSAEGIASFLEHRPARFTGL